MRGTRSRAKKIGGVAEGIVEIPISSRSCYQHSVMKGQTYALSELTIHERVCTTVSMFAVEAVYFSGLYETKYCSPDLLLSGVLFFSKNSSRTFSKVSRSVTLYTLCCTQRITPNAMYHLAPFEISVLAWTISPCFSPSRIQQVNS